MESSVRIIFLLAVMRLSAAEEVNKTLSGSVGGNITLPDPVQEKGFLLYGGKNIAMVNKREPEILERTYMKKVHWDGNTGLFTLTDLQRSDSGIYTIDSKTGQSLPTSYKLTVYDAVSTPVVQKLAASSEICSLLCSVDKETTLLWFKDEQILNRSSSALSLLLTVQQQDFSSSYRCVAANPAEEKTLPVNVKTYCGGNDTNGDYPKHRNYTILYVVFSILLVLVVIVAAFIIKKKYLTENKTNGQAQGPVSTEEEVQYSDIRIYENGQAEDLPDSSTTIGHSSLTTVYDKLEVHRMISEPADNN